ncbi:reverse transcriptase domain-containing protein, partial [Parashewanella curva]
MRNGVVEERQRGTPQGGPLSPLLSNIVLDELDKELERRGHKFCRYADDSVQIYVGSEKTAERVKASITDFLESKLKLKVNRAKSAASKVSERNYLGHKFQQSGRIGISQASIKKMKKRVRVITKRNRGRNELVIIKELNQFLRGWQHYFKLGIKKGQMSD